MENKSCGLIVIERKRGALDDILEQQQGRTDLNTEHDQQNFKYLVICFFLKKIIF